MQIISLSFFHSFSLWKSVTNEILDGFITTSSHFSFLVLSCFSVHFDLEVDFCVWRTNVTLQEVGMGSMGDLRLENLCRPTSFGGKAASL